MQERGTWWRGRSRARADSDKDSLLLPLICRCSLMLGEVTCMKDGRSKNLTLT
jgi:hypothetical protein